MNERIEELLTQSRKEVWSNNPFNGSPEFDGYEVDQEKLAELIVKECATVAFRLAPSDESACDISAGIEEHFGVK